LGVEAGRRHETGPAPAAARVAVSARAVHRDCDRCASRNRGMARGVVAVAPRGARRRAADPRERALSPRRARAARGSVARASLGRARRRHARVPRGVARGTQQRSHHHRARAALARGRARRRRNSATGRHGKIFERRSAVARLRSGCGPRAGACVMTGFANLLWLLLVFVVLARILLLALDRRARVGAFGFSSFSLVAPSRGVRAMTSAIPFFLESLALLLLIVALARPQRITRLAAGDRYGIDIVVALDASGSMAAEDFRPRNRFAVAKDLIAEFIRRRQDDRIGIVTFGSRAATRVPITYDRRIAEMILDQAEIGDHGNGTAIGHALATSVNRLRTSKTRSRVVILVTDGVNNSGSIDPIVAAQLAARSGIKVYTIGVGSEGPVPLPVKRQNPFTGQIETIYTHIRGELDEKSLSSIASM